MENFRAKNGKRQTTYTLKKIIKKVSLLSLIIISCLIFSDVKGYFESNNGRLAKVWDHFYQFTENHPIDILLLGNSHVYKSIRPSQLNATLGTYTFSLSAPCIHIGEIYFCLKEALKRSKPKLVIVETFGIIDFDPYDLPKSELPCQYGSFSKRRDIVGKMESTPLLFTPTNYLYAWSNTIRNHNFLFTRKQQLIKNILPKQKNKEEPFYFGDGLDSLPSLTDSTLQLYDSLPSPVKGQDYTYSKYTKKYVEQIITLCQEQGIKLAFFTAPVYYKNIEDYSVWKGKLGELLGKQTWLDLQENYDCERFTPTCFENVYGPNQHLTFEGEIVATKKLAQFIQAKYGSDLPNRKKDSLWQQLYQGK